MIEQEAKEYTITRTYPKFEDSYITNFVIREVEGAYIAGASAHSIKWHDLRKDPNDLPKNSDNEKLYLVYCGTNNYSVAQFNDDRWCTWYDEEDIIAWCELTKFEEE